MADADQTRFESSRRTFLTTGAAACAGAALTSVTPTLVHAAGNDTIKVALIGCGNRGAGAAVQALSTNGSVKLWAVADAFSDRLEACLDVMQRGWQRTYDRDPSLGVKDRMDVPPERRFVGLDAYRKAIDSSVDVVLLCEPPGFRPKHFEYAVNAGKHVFMEKPVAADVAGVKRVLAAAEEARKKDLKVGVGLQRHHEPVYHQALEQFQSGAIGDLTSMRCYWNTGFPGKTTVPRGDMTELEYQVRNWYFFTWLSGDHICEQHVHNLDACNWFVGKHPVEAQGVGGRQMRTGHEYGNIYDHHMVEFTYDDGLKLHSQCRQIPGCWNQVGESFAGTKGTLNTAVASTIIADGKRVWRSKSNPGGRKGAYQTEHDVLFDAIRTGKAHNEADYGATSTLTGILGRMATYTGKVVTWDEALASDQRLTTDAEDWNAEAPVNPRDDGSYAVAIPGKTTIA
ncbi:MAG TPA: Gfo/Idh/MocA family oxidoreductase [Lacipirellula sp.]